MELDVTRVLKQAAAWVGFCAAGCGLCAAAEVSSASAPPPKAATQESLTIPLEYHEVSFSPMGLSLRTDPNPGTLKKEPQVATSDVRRGRLSLPNAEADLLPFLWDRTHRKLYLDLNRNQDLTDDPAGVFSAPDASGSDRGDFRFANFQKVPLTIQTAEGRIPWLVDLNFSEYRGRLSVYAAVHSFWTGKALLGGREWQVGWLPGLGQRQDLSRRDYLLIRDWSRRVESFSTSDGSLDTFELPQKLHLPPSTYEVVCAHKPEGDKVNHQITFREQPLELGELNISGQFIRRLLLTHGPCVAVLDSPGGKVRVPAGRYANHRVQLGNGDSLASLQADPTQPLVITTQTAATLNAGGPLTNSATFSRRDDQLIIKYQLLGAGGGIYAQAQRDYQHPPRFTVFQGERKLDSGDFQYG